MKPRVVHVHESQRISLYDIALRYGIGADETDGGLSMLEVKPTS